MTIIPMNCGHCFYRDKVSRWCLHRKRPVSNVNTCDDWRPELYVFSMKDVGFAAYDQYRIKEKPTTKEGEKKC